MYCSDAGDKALWPDVLCNMSCTLYGSIHLHYPLALLHIPGIGDKGQRPTFSRTMTGLLQAVVQNSQYLHHAKALLHAQTASPRVAQVH